MPTVKLVLDCRKKLKENKYNLTVRVCQKGKVQYLPIPNAKLTVSQYDQVLVRESMDEGSIKFRESVNEFKTRCERFYSEMTIYNPKRFREQVYSKDKDVPKTCLIIILRPAGELLCEPVNTSGCR